MKTPQEIEIFINQVLRVELGNMEIALNRTNDDVTEYMELEKSLEFLKKYKSDGFKTQVDVGSNTFLEAEVDKIEPILINVGLNVYLELELDEALKFLESKIKILTKESEVIRDQSLKIRSEIKILLMYLAEQQGFGVQNKLR